MKNDGKRKAELRKELVRAYSRVTRRQTRGPKTRRPGQGTSESDRPWEDLHKTEAIGQAAARIAQYFSSILTLIVGYGSFVQMKLGEDDPLKPYVRQILASSERASLLTRSLLAFSRKHVLRPQPVNVNDVIRRVAKLLKRVVGENVELKTHFSATPMTVRADPVQLEQVLMNLATNARDAMPVGGTLVLKTGQLELGSKFANAFRDNGPWECALISISDNGIGMEKEVQERIFEPFFTTKEAGKGTGLGLSIVYGIVKQHNGTINVTSEPGKGSTFNIYLPLLHEQPANVRHAVPAMSGATTSTWPYHDADMSGRG